MRKRTSRRRWKARARLGRTVPWSAIIEHRLTDWGRWERRHEYIDAYLIDLLSTTTLRAKVEEIAGAMMRGDIVRVSETGIEVISPEEFYSKEH